MVAFVNINPNTQILDLKTGLLTRDGFQVFQAILSFYQGANSAAVTTDGIETLTNKTMDGDANTFTDIGTASLKTKTGSGGRVVTGTASPVNTMAKWDSSGNLTGGVETAVNDTVATVLGSLGPVGSNVAVQGWAVQRDSAGTILGYTPYF